MEEALTEVRGGKIVATLTQGDDVTVAPGDAVFLLRPSVAGGPGSGD